MIVATFSDDRSGLSLKGRPGLSQLLAAALGDQPRFSTILVYDVSRWGRFQDLDEGAHYEFLCRQAGVAVEYCVEPFDNDGSPHANLIKQIKRSMAAEYSRDLSRRISAAKHALASRGVVVGAPAPYGMRRLAVDHHGAVRGALRRGERRMVANLRTTFAPGTRQEVATVQRIFRLFVVTGASPGLIATTLSAEGVDCAPNKTWNANAIRRLLSNEAYVGTYVYGRTSSRLGAGCHPVSPAQWIRAERAFKPLVSQEIFDAAQPLLHLRRRRSDDRLLDDLRGLLAEKGRLDTGLIDQAEKLQSSACYIKRFGGLRRAYALIGYQRACVSPDRRKRPSIAP